MVNVDNLNPAHLLERPMTADYEPQSISTHMAFSSRRPSFNVRWVRRMLQDQRVQFGLRMIKGPCLSSARFYIKDPDSTDDKPSEIKEYLIKNVSRFWRHSASKALRAIEWGFSANEALYRLEEDKICFDTLKIIKPHDVKLVTRDGEKAGISVQNIKGRQGRVYIGGPKSLWHIHGREENPFYGLSRLFGAFQPWLEFHEDGGAKDIRRLYYHKYAFSGDVGYYPVGVEPGAQYTPGTQVRSNREIMRSMLAKRKTGASIMFPGTYDADGNLKWRIDTPQPGPGAAPILEYHDSLKNEIFEGIGVPNEVAEAAETGSGFSGRKVPQDAFFSMLQEIVDWLIYDFDQQILRPMIHMNFGIENHPYEIIPFGLLHDKEMDQADDPDKPVSPLALEQDEDPQFSRLVI